MANKTSSSKFSKNKFPILERITEFHRGDFKENLDEENLNEDTNSFCDLLDYVEFANEEEHERLTDNSLIINNITNDINVTYKFNEEFPIVVYRCNENDNANSKNCINAFIKSITVSTVNSGIAFSFYGDIHCEYADFQTMAYFTDNLGRNIAIPHYDIARILLKKPNLVVSNEGLLIFYTENEILVTLDCIHYAYIYDPDECAITKIEVLANDDYCYVYVKNIEEGDETDTVWYKLGFKVDMLNEDDMICPTVIVVKTDAS